MEAWSVCPGCGVRLPASGQPSDPKRSVSAECWQVAAEVTGFELEHTAQLGRFHQLSVDAYGAQHADASGTGIRVAYSLVGLYLALERGMNGLQVRRIHQSMGKPQPDWPHFPRPGSVGKLTALDVALAGARVSSVEGHINAVQKWARSVWEAWSAQHQAIAGLCDRFAGRYPGYRRPAER
jgi:hypothetical protein